MTLFHNSQLESHPLIIHVVSNNVVRHVVFFVILESSFKLYIIIILYFIQTKFISIILSRNKGGKDMRYFLINVLSNLTEKKRPPIKLDGKSIETNYIIILIAFWPETSGINHREGHSTF